MSAQTPVKASKGLAVTVDLEDSQIATIAERWMDDRLPPITQATIQINGIQLDQLRDELAEQAADRVLAALRQRFKALRDDG